MIAINTPTALEFVIERYNPKLDTVSTAHMKGLEDLLLEARKDAEKLSVANVNLTTTLRVTQDRVAQSDVREQVLRQRIRDLEQQMMPPAVPQLITVNDLVTALTNLESEVKESHVRIDNCKIASVYYVDGDGDGPDYINIESE